MRLLVSKLMEEAVIFLGARIRHFAKRRSPSNMVKELFGHFPEKLPHFKEEIYEMSKLIGNNNNSWQIW
jgi:hypothetical protein